MFLGLKRGAIRAMNQADGYDAYRIAAGINVGSKARDIVPGWPRSRSTSTFGYSPHFIYAGAADHLYSVIYCPFYRYDGDDQRRFEEIQANYEYHQAQQRMVTDHLEQPLNRMLDNFRFDNLITSGKSNDVFAVRDCLLAPRR